MAPESMEGPQDVFSSFVNGTPYIQIEVSGWNTAAPVTLTAVIDTGFSGFLQMPLLSAFPVGLVLHTMMDITLADGSVQNKLVCHGNIHYSGQIHSGLVLIEEQDADILVGIEFLQTFQLRLILDASKQTVELTHP